MSKGITFSKMENYQDAIKSYDMALKYNPQYIEAIYNKAITLNRVGRLKESNELHFNLQSKKIIDKCAPIIKGDANSTKEYLAKGKCLLIIQLYPEALEAYNMAIKLNPNCAEAYGAKGSILTTTKKYQEALKVYDMAIKLKPDYAEFYKDKGYTLSKLKDHQEALKNYDVALIYKPNDKDTLYLKASTLRDLCRTKEAKEIYDQLGIVLIEDYTKKAEEKKKKPDSSSAPS